MNQDDNVVDISLSNNIKCIETFPVSNDIKSINSIYHTAEYECWSETFRSETPKQAYLIFNMGGCNIDSFEIKSVNWCPLSTIKVYTSDDIKDEWELIESKRNIQKDETTKFSLYYTHKTLIKIEIDEPKKSVIVGISRLKWFGFEPVIKDEVTNKIKVFQSSGTSNGYPTDNIFKTSLLTWKSSGGIKSFLIFDCGKIEIDKIYIQFAKQSKPEIIKLSLSETPNAYSFKTVPFRKWKLKTSQLYDLKTWNDISLEEEFKLSQDGTSIDLYENGFKRYLQIEFLKYMTDKMEIVCVRFFGHESKKIAQDSEQFDPVLDFEQKQYTNDSETTTETFQKQKLYKINKRPKDDTSDDENDEKEHKIEQYKPKIVDNTETSSGFDIKSIWKDGIHPYWQPMIQMKNKEAYLVIDLGNNNVNSLVIKVFYRHPSKICKLYTSDNLKGKHAQWTLLFVDNQVKSKLDKGCRFEVNGKHKKYVKVVFNEIDSLNFGVSELFVYGKSPFLKEEPKEITWNDINNMDDGKINEKLITQFDKQESKKYSTALALWYNKIRAIEQDPNKGKLSKEWIVAKTEDIQRFSNSILKKKIRAKLSKTVFEEQQILKICDKQMKLADDYVPTLMNLIIETETKKQELKNAMNKANEISGKNYRENKKKELEMYEQKSSDKLSAIYTQRNKEIELIGLDSTKELVYKEWKQSIEKHPLKISNKYNVMDYDAMILYAQNHKKDEMKCLWSKLADLMDESLIKKKQLMHKYHVFKLSRYYYDARKREYGRDPVFILFDCGDRKLDRIQMKVNKHSYFNKIEVYTAQQLQEQKLDNDDDDSYDNIDFKNNFSLIGSLELDDIPKTQDISFEQTRIELNFQNLRYVKVVFSDFGSQNKGIKIQQIKFFIKSNDLDELDQNEVTSKSQLAKHKLKLVKESGDTSATLYTIDQAYLLNDKRYYASIRNKTPYLIFDCETSKVDKFEVKFSNFRPFKTIIVSTSDNLDTIDDSKEWDEIFKNENISDMDFTKKIH
eukprot:10771_1